MLEDVKPQTLAELEEELRLDLAAIIRMRAMMARKNDNTGVPQTVVKQPVVVAPVKGSEEEMEDFRDYDEGGTGDGYPATSLIGSIAITMNSDPSVRWTTNKMLAHLKGSGFPLLAKKPLYSIGQAITKLVDRGEIRMLRRGAGSRPNIYCGTVREDKAHESNQNGAVLTM